MVDARDEESTMPTSKDNMVRPISKSEGKALAETLGAVSYLECSAKRSELGLKAVFDEAIKVALNPPPTNYSIRKRFCGIL